MLSIFPCMLTRRSYPKSPPYVDNFSTWSTLSIYKNPSLFPYKPHIITITPPHSSLRHSPYTGVHLFI